jgi:hypothetical protein
MVDRHAKREITIFKAFANSCRLPIRQDTIKKMEPLKPDIQCEVEGTGFVAFELVEIIDRNYANMFGKQRDTRGRFLEYHANKGSSLRLTFVSYFDC